MSTPLHHCHVLLCLVKEALLTNSLSIQQVMRQLIMTRDILLHLRNAQLTSNDQEQLMKQTPAQAEDLAPFKNALYLHPTIEAVVEHNVVMPVANQ